MIGNEPRRDFKNSNGARGVLFRIRGVVAFVVPIAAISGNPASAAEAQVQYRGNDEWEVALGARNLLDKNSQLAFGYPEAGRTYYAKLSLDFQ